MARDDPPGSDETGDSRERGAESEDSRERGAESEDSRERGAESEDSREQGVEFGQLAAELEAREYPVTLDELLAEHGDAELDVADGTVSLRQILGPLAAGDADGDEQRFESAEGVRQSVFNMVGDEAIGREDYSDRGGSLQDEVAAGEDEEPESL